MINFKLSDILKKEKLSQTKFSKLCGVRPNTVNDICNNKIKRLELKTLDKILESLFIMGYTLNDFIDFDKGMKNDEETK